MIFNQWPNCFFTIWLTPKLKFTCMSQIISRARQPRRAKQPRFGVQYRIYRWIKCGRMINFGCPKFFRMSPSAAGFTSMESAWSTITSNRLPFHFSPIFALALINPRLETALPKTSQLTDWHVRSQLWNKPFQNLGYWHLDW